MRTRYGVIPAGCWGTPSPVCPWGATPFIFSSVSLAPSGSFMAFIPPQLRLQTHLGKHSPPLNGCVNLNSGRGLLYVGIGRSAHAASLHKRTLWITAAGWRVGLYRAPRASVLGSRSEAWSALPSPLVSALLLGRGPCQLLWFATPRTWTSLGGKHTTGVTGAWAKVTPHPWCSLVPSPLPLEAPEYSRRVNKQMEAEG